MAGAFRNSLVGKVRRSLNKSVASEAPQTQARKNSLVAKAGSQQSQLATQLMRQNLQRARVLEEERYQEQLHEEEVRRFKREELDRLNQSVRENNLRSLERRKKRSKSACIYSGGQNNQRTGDTGAPEKRRVRKKSFVLEFRAVKREVEAEIKLEDEERKNAPVLF